MSDELLVSQCAPTLAGLKTANMFSAEYESREEVTAQLRRLNAVLVPKGLRILPMRYMQSRVLLYLYRPTRCGATSKTATLAISCATAATRPATARKAA